MGECADYRNRLGNVDAVEHLRQFSTVDFGPPDPKRFLSGAFDEFEDLFTVLLSDGVAEDRAEQPDVLPHGLRGLTPDPGAVDGADGRQRSGVFNHASSIDVPDVRRMTAANRSAKPTATMRNKAKE
jgi:hypothetical protein